MRPSSAFCGRWRCRMRRPGCWPEPARFSEPCGQAPAWTGRWRPSRRPSCYRCQAVNAPRKARGTSLTGAAPMVKAWCAVGGLFRPQPGCLASGTGRATRTHRTVPCLSNLRQASELQKMQGLLADRYARDPQCIKRGQQRQCERERGRDNGCGYG